MGDRVCRLDLAQCDVDAGDLETTARWLATHQMPGGGWGYNHHWPVDADSIANALLFLATRAEVPTDRWSPARERLLATQHADGSFTTILDPEAWLVRFRSTTPEVTGWTASHPCVTAVVGLLLARLDGERERAGATRALAYLLRCQRAEGAWDAYWWMGGLYTTCRAIEAMTELGRHTELPGAERSLSRAIAWVAGSQRPDGGWATAEHGRSKAFHTALAVQALCTVPCPEPTVAGAVARGLRWLVAHQLPDGSWPATPILRVPRPDCVAPWEQTTWAESNLGLDVVVADWRRLFTTATVIRALYSVAENGEDTAAAPTGALPHRAGRDDA